MKMVELKPIVMNVLGKRGAMTQATGKFRVLLVVELMVSNLDQIAEALAVIKPPRIPHFSGKLRVTMDGFPDEPATAIVNFLDGEGENAT